VRRAYNPHVPIVEKFREPQPPGAVRACPGLYSNSFTARRWGGSYIPMEGDADTLWIGGFVCPQRRSWRGGEEILAAGSDRISAVRVSQSLYRRGWRVSVLKVVSTLLILDLYVTWTKILQICLLKHKKSNPTTSLKEISSVVWEIDIWPERQTIGNLHSAFIVCTSCQIRINGRTRYTYPISH